MVPLLVLASSEETDGDAGDDVGEHGEPDEQGLRQRGLVELAGHEEEGLGVGH